MLKKILLMAAFLVPVMGYSHDYSRVRYETVDRPRQKCWTESVRSHSQDYTGVVLGGIAGGLLGNQVGRGNGRVVATAIGATTGAMVGDNLAGSPRHTSYRNVQRCRTVVDHVRVPVAVPQEVVYVDRERYVSYPEPVYIEQEHYRHDNGYHQGWYKHRSHEDDEGKHKHHKHKHHHYDHDD
jgi:uncharacterized protein YcfJ